MGMDLEGDDHGGNWDKVSADLEAVEKQVEAAPASELKTKTMDNIAAMKKDVADLEAADEGRKGKLGEALKLRMKALKSQMGKMDLEADSQVEAPMSHHSKVEADLEAVEKRIESAP